jgi:hypothetical protein
MLLQSIFLEEGDMTAQKNRRQRRNDAIRHDINTYRKLGIAAKVAIRMTAEKYYLAPSTVHDIVYRDR